MKTLNSKLMLLALTLATLQISPSAFAQDGGNAGGGGSTYESEFKSIAQNISDWVKSGNADQLQLPEGLSTATFKKRMMETISHTSIEMVTQPISVGGINKTCAGTKLSAVKNLIRCYRPDFASTYQSSVDQTYRLVFHEYAGLALVEKNVGGVSDYSVSDQISKYLKDEVVRRLPIVKTSVSGAKSSSLLKCSPGHLVLLQKGEFGSDYYGTDLTIDPVDLAGFFRWLRLSPTSPLAKAEEKAGRCNPKQTLCDRDELVDLAPEGGVLVETDDNSADYGDVTTTTRFVEKSQHTVHGTFSRYPVLEVDIETYSHALEDSVPAGSGNATRAVSEVFIKAIRTVAGEQRRLIYVSKEKSGGSYKGCKPVTLPPEQIAKEDTAD